MSTRSIEAMHNLNATELEEIMSAVMDGVEENSQQNVPKITIKPVNTANGTYRTGGLVNLTKSQIINVLGFKPNVDDDPDKVVNSWAFTIDGDLCAIWDYKGSHLFNRWSCYDPTGALPALFDVSNIIDGGW